MKDFNCGEACGSRVLKYCKYRYELKLKFAIYDYCLINLRECIIAFLLNSIVFISA